MVYVYGQGGGSTALADELRFRLVRFGRPVASYQDSLLQRMVAATLSRDAVVVALSVSGRVPELLESCRLAKRYGATLIATTADDQTVEMRGDGTTLVGFRLAGTGTTRLTTPESTKVEVTGRGVQVLDNVIDGGAGAGIFVFGGAEVAIVGNEVLSTLAD
ncbi:SIS domain-containing protein, partial [Paraburkholderia sp. SIMBA_049]